MSKLITISGYKIMMTEKEEAKLLKNKKMKEAEMPKILATP
jgi:DNA-directed RNA polymerase subunit H (RpoH/RPB5)